MAYGSANEGGYGADMPDTRREQSDHSGGADSVSGGSALGRVHGADGEVSITRSGGSVVRVRAGDRVFHGDVIETGADGFVTIAFADGSRFRLAPNTAFALDQTFSAETARSTALVRVLKGVFAFVTGRSAIGRFVIDTPVGRIRGSSQAIGIGSLAFGALTLGLIHDLKAASADLGLLDDGTIDYRDLKHGVFEIRTKEAHPRIIVVDDPSVTVELRPRGGGTVGVDEVANTPAQMAQLQSAFQGAYSTFTQGQQDPFIQQLQQGGPNDHANAQPNTTTGSVGSSTAVNELNSGAVGQGQIGGTQLGLNLGGGAPPGTLPAGGAPIGGTVPPSLPPVGGASAIVQWVSLSGGNWESAPSWSDGLVPGSGTTVQILTPITVTLNSGESISGLVIVAGATLDIVVGGSLTIAGNVDNGGTIILDDPPLTYSGSVSLTGGGVIQMIGASSANLISGAPGVTLTNVDNTIVGSALIGTGDGHLTFINQGIVDATPLNAGDSGLIVINTGNQVTNAGVFEATGGGTLTIDDALLNSGKLEANGGIVDVAGAVSGSGSALVSGGGTFEIGSTDAQAFAFNGAGTLKLDAGSDFTGAITLAAGAVIDLAGTIVNSAEISGFTVFINGNPETFTIAGLPVGDTLAFKSDGGAGSDLAVLPQILSLSTTPVSGAAGSAITLKVQDTLSSGATLTSFTLSDIPSGATLTNSHGDTFTVTNGTITFTAAQIADGVLNGLSITLANSEAFILSVLALAVDGNGYEYTVEANENVIVTNSTVDTWQGPANGAWSTGANWSNGSPPSSGQEAIINSGATPDVTTNVTVDQVLLQNAGTITVASGVTFTLDDGTEVTGGTIALNSSATLALDTVTLDAVTLDGGTESLSGGVTIGADGATIENATVDGNGNTISASGATLTLSAVTLDDVTLSGGTDALTGGVTIGADGATIESATVDGNGNTITVSGTTLTLNGDTFKDVTLSGGTDDLTGALTIAASSEIDSATVEGSGASTKITVNSGQTLTLNGDTFKDVTLSGGTDDLTGTLTIAASSEIENATVSGGTIALDPGVTLTLDNVTLDSGTVQFSGSGAATLQLEGTITGQVTAISIGSAPITITGDGDVTATASGADGIYAGSAGGDIIITADGSVSGASSAIVAEQGGAGNITISAGPGVTVSGAALYGIAAVTEGSGSLSISTAAGDVIDSASTAIVAENQAGAIAAGAGSSIVVTAYGTIESGAQTTSLGHPADGIAAGYLPDRNEAADLNVTGTVTVNNFANITALGEAAINAFNYGNGDVTVNDNYGAGAIGSTDISGLDYGIDALALSGGTGNVTVNLGLNAIISTSTGADGLFGIFALNEDTGNITVTMSAGDKITSGSAGILAVSWAAASASTITVTAAGTINSGTNLEDGGAPPAGIIAGFNPGNAEAPDGAVTGNVFVTSDATIQAAAGFGI